VWSVETHAHADHITSAGLLAEEAGARTAAPAGCHIGTAAVQLQHGDVLRFGSEELKALHTPGHTAGSMSYVWRGNVFTGDTLLIDGCGRTDFQSGSAAQLYRSITEVLFALPQETIVWPGHDYHGRARSTIGQEKATNARVAGRTLAEFVKIMDELNLPKPRRIDEAVPANLSSGLRHDAGGGAAQFKPAQGYAGDVAPQLACEWWQRGDAVLVDVRTKAEREWVGFVPGAAGVSWKEWPGMAVNPDFDEQVRKAVPPGKKALMLCRSGVRSIAAARRATELGIEAYNVLEGFEGDPDENGQRGKRGGWRLRGLPWRQG
jgi:rhodanese-related sulfurtransferase